MVAHSQFCMPGDHTMQASREAANLMDAYEGGPHVLVVVSDANFRRYGMDPADWAASLTSQKGVDSHAVIVGGFGDEPTRVAAGLPPGRIGFEFPIFLAGDVGAGGPYLLFDPFWGMFCVFSISPIL